MKKSKDDREFDEMMREEIESGNPFAGYSSYANYKAKNRTTPTEKKQIKEVLPFDLFNYPTIIDAEPNEQRAEMKRELFLRDTLNILKPEVE